MINFSLVLFKKPDCPMAGVVQNENDLYYAVRLFYNEVNCVLVTIREIAHKCLKKKMH